VNDIRYEIELITPGLNFIEEHVEGAKSLIEQTNKTLHQAAERIDQLEAALREPTLDMLIAGKKSLYSCSEDPELDDARKCFKAMVAALGEKKDG